MTAKMMCGQRGSERVTVIRKLIRSENGRQGWGGGKGVKMTVTKNNVKVNMLNVQVIYV